MNLEGLDKLCVCCGQNENLHKHHIIPRFMLKDEQKFIPKLKRNHSVKLCDYCYSCINFLRSKWIFEYRKFEKKIAIDKLYNRTISFVENKGVDKNANC